MIYHSQLNKDNIMILWEMSNENNIPCKRNRYAFHLCSCFQMCILIFCIHGFYFNGGIMICVCTYNLLMNAIQKYLKLILYSKRSYAL